MGLISVSDKEKIFYQTKIRIIKDEQAITLHTYVSPYGAARVIKEDSLTPFLEQLMGKEITVQIKANLIVKGIFVRDSTADGVFYNIRFTTISAEQRL